MRFAYADPPYLGCCALYEHYHGDDGRCWDHLETHAALIERLAVDFPDGWALSMTSGNLIQLAPHLPNGVRVAAWAKSFASFKPNVNPAYTWEPVVFAGGRRGDRERPTVKDHLVEPITLRKGLTGAKPEVFCRWVLDLLGFEPGDTVDDLYPGTGVMQCVVERASNEITFAEASA